MTLLQELQPGDIVIRRDRLFLVHKVEPCQCMERCRLLVIRGKRGGSFSGSPDAVVPLYSRLLACPNCGEISRQRPGSAWCGNCIRAQMPTFNEWLREQAERITQAVPVDTGYFRLAQ